MRPPESPCRCSLFIDLQGEEHVDERGPVPAPDDAQVGLGGRRAAAEPQAQVQGLPAAQHEVGEGGAAGRGGGADAAGGLRGAGHRGAAHVAEVVGGQLVAQSGTDMADFVGIEL